jgi:hypothetical protein
MNYEHTPTTTNSADQRRIPAPCVIHFVLSVTTVVQCLPLLQSLYEPLLEMPGPCLGIEIISADAKTGQATNSRGNQFKHRELEPNMFCDHCLRIFHSYDPNSVGPEAKPHHETSHSLAQSSQLGCFICSTLVRSRCSPPHRLLTKTTYEFLPLQDDAVMCYSNEIAMLDGEFVAHSTGKVLSLKFAMSGMDGGMYLLLTFRLDLSKGK